MTCDFLGQTPDVMEINGVFFIDKSKDNYYWLATKLYS